ncbi:MAG: hypothetical protein ACP5NS_02085 [Candidatus Pacearchaeota archaeon]
MSSNREVNEQDVVLCTVTLIDNANVLVSLDESGLKGSIFFAEISPGRIRNIREFVSIGKKIVCKVLRKKEDHLELSLRRVTSKEREEVMQHYKNERVLASILKPILNEKVAETIANLKKDNPSDELLEKLREQPEIIKKYVTASQLEQLKKNLTEKQEKEKVVQVKVSLKSDSEEGIIQIRDTLQTNDADISYLGSGQFLIRVKGKEYKQANIQLDKVVNNIKEKAKAHKIQLEIK